MRDAIEPECPLFVTSDSREQVTGFLADLVQKVFEGDLSCDGICMKLKF